MNDQSLESDLDFAFRLQLQEAMSDSLALNPSTSSTPAPVPKLKIPIENVTETVRFESEELSKLEKETQDRKRSIAVCEESKLDLHHRIHDRNLDRQNFGGSEVDLREKGGLYETPFEEGTSSKGGGCGDNEVFRVYLKGLICEEKVEGSKVMLAGIGVAICDTSDTVIFEIKKPLVGAGTSMQGVGVRAFIEGLNAALALNLKRLQCYVDYYPLFKYITRKWTPKSAQVAALVYQVFALQDEFSSFRVNFVARTEIKFAFKLARQAIISQITGPIESSNGNNPKESCVICLEDSEVGQIFSIDNCLHRYCFSCMKQHVEVKLLHGMLPKCPHEACKSELNVDSCAIFLTPKLIEIMGHRLKEASIPTTDKIYCPYPRCSALMSRIDLQEPSSYHINLGLGARSCGKCNRIFCIHCKVPWHNNLTCNEYKKLNPQCKEEEAKLKSLATINLWRQCVKCNHMIELAEGCNHMTCRCGYQFCYACGAEWRNKMATCTCPLLDEHNISDDDDFYDEDEYEEDDDDYEEVEEAKEVEEVERWKRWRWRLESNKRVKSSLSN